MALAPSQRPIAAKRCRETLTAILLAASLVFVPAIEAVAAVVLVIKEVHIKVLIKEGCAHLQIIALCSAESEFRKQHNQVKYTDQFCRARAIIPGNGDAGSEGDEIPLITTDHGGLHISEVIAAAMHAVSREEVSDASFPSVRTSSLGSARKSRDGEGTYR